MSKPTSKIVSRAMFDRHRGIWIRQHMRNRPYIMDVRPDDEIPTYSPRDVVLLWEYAHRLQRAVPLAFDRGREQGRKMERNGLKP